MYTLPLPTTPTKSPLLTPIAEIDYDFRSNLLDDEIIASQNRYTHLYCKYCHKKLGSKAGKAKHEKSHYKNIIKEQRAKNYKKNKKSRVYTCKECDEQFDKRGSLNQHVKTHKNDINLNDYHGHLKDRLDIELQDAILNGKNLAKLNGTIYRTRSRSRIEARSVPLNYRSCYNGAATPYSDYGSETKSYYNNTRSTTSLSITRSNRPRKRKKYIEDWINHYRSDEDDDDDIDFDDSISMRSRSTSRTSHKYPRSFSVLTDGSVSPPSSVSSAYFSPETYLCSDEKCLKPFRTLYLVTMHEIRDHKKLALFRCTECRLRFTSRENLSQHRELNHPLDTIECLLCDMKLSGITAIIEHVNLHKRYSAKCQVCSKVFLSKYFLDEHLKNKSKHKSYKKTKASILLRFNYANKKAEVTHFLDLNLFDTDLKFASYTEIFFYSTENDKNSFNNRIRELHLPWRC